ncbi:efflux RND transporter periplasmic adaptor subunit [Chitinophaga nivalis]|uniref:Efflux RND transporter periplasmic adaptor subunit n=1 Tax=Chitinophaga nivalis TaxID=2991709 RepID=A0ABT3IQU0_9BACT|nr:efflux RND transporter periplasmic adaptor subunit [Chitinophaga nivalis]MCW3464180.1 efflux RND transporter periplasmic adaptor subunit [Chitinophaga nivalis]MCW3486130.1 efflux RND transporter periplasmic adaptor subunit [Chitinophaga nivalis]
MKRIIPGLMIASISLAILSCGSHEPEKKNTPASNKPIVQDSGRVIQFPADSLTLSYFHTAVVTKSDLNTALTAPARVVATIVPSREDLGQNIVLFDNADLTANYTEMLQHTINIREKASIIQQKKAIVSQKQIELSRFQDLVEHGAGTGKDVSTAKTDLISAQTDVAVAQTELANEKTAIIEHESKLKLAGFDPQAVLHAQPGKVWIICDMPENQVNKVKEGSTCTLQFTSYPNETFTGTIEDIGEVVDNITRMVKLRIGVRDGKKQLRAGMFASVKFDVSEGNTLSVPRSVLITVQGKNYVFVKGKAAHSFERREVLTGAQVADRVVIYTGLQEGDIVVTDGAMELKGISFGY